MPLLPRLAACALALAGALAVPVHAAPTGLTETARVVLSPRLVELTMTTPALGAPTKVRVLLPAGYAASRERYPVLYLLNGGGGSYLDWTTQGGAEAATASTRAIVVMPDGGTGGNYTDWYSADGTGFTPRWETYHVGQLVPWVDAHFRTLPTRDQRAVAGLSMGGNGALHYAARHPDVFVAAASFSGANDVFQPLIRPITETTGITEGALPGAVFGPSITEEVRWRASNPVDLTGNLKDTWVSLAFGNGMPGGPDGNRGVDPIEMAVHDANVLLHDRLLASGVPHLYDDYGNGAHNWFYWTRELKDALPSIAKVFAQHRPDPVRFTYAATEASYDVWGWRVRLTRPVLEASRLEARGAAGFTLSGTGSAVVTTGPVYHPNKRYSVTVVDADGTHATTVTAGRDRRLTVAVDLGPANPYQQYSAQSQLSGTTVREAVVTVTPTSGKR